MKKTEITQNLRHRKREMYLENWRDIHTLEKLYKRWFPSNCCIVNLPMMTICMFNWKENSKQHLNANEHFWLFLLMGR